MSDLDLHLLGQGTHRRLWEVLGARVGERDGTAGTTFAVWAPSASAVAVAGDWNGWDTVADPMRSLGASGVWEAFVPGVGAGARYKYAVVGADGRSRMKADPLARRTEEPVLLEWVHHLLEPHEIGLERGHVGEQERQALVPAVCEVAQVERRDVQAVHRCQPSSGAIGIANEKIDPTPSPDSTQMRPPCCSTTCRAIASPRPEPSVSADTR